MTDIMKYYALHSIPIAAGKHALTLFFLLIETNCSGDIVF
jgi:hypothetical protein